MTHEHSPSVYWRAARSLQGSFLEHPPHTRQHCRGLPYITTWNSLYLHTYTWVLSLFIYILYKYYLNTCTYCKKMIYKKVVRNDLFIRSFRWPNMYFSDKSGLHSQFLKMLQSHKGAVEVLLFMTVTCRSHPRAQVVPRRTNHVMRGLEPSGLPQLLGRYGGLQAGSVNDLINLDYVRKAP